MGGGTWSTVAYSNAAATRVKKGESAFGYTKTMFESKPRDRVVHPSLDPKGAIRESRDSDEHPNSLPVAVTFDVTGSMRRVPQVLQTKLAFLMDFLVGTAGLPDAQVLVSAVGDATSDRVPFQFGQFESDNRVDEHLRNIFLEGNGGGQYSESYGLALYAAARKVRTDAWEKRQKKGYWFLIGDEMSWPMTVNDAANIFGDTLQANLSIEELVAEVKEQWELYHILPAATSYGHQARMRDYWRELLGQNSITIEDDSLICELIAGQVALGEGTAFHTVKKRVGDIANSLVNVKCCGGGCHSTGIVEGGASLPAVPADIDRL